MKKITFLFALMLCMNYSFKAQILFSETFSTSLNQCVATNSSNANWVWSSSCAQSTVTGHSVSGHAIFVGSGCQFGSSGTVSGNLNTPTMTIGPSGAVLTFNYYLQNECTGSSTNCSYDILSLQISTNGGTSFTSLVSNATTNTLIANNATWTPVTYALNTYSNQTIMLRFNFNSVDGIDNAYDGVYVDDIIVTSNCSINLTNSVNNSTVSPFICAGNNLTLTTNAVSNFSWSTGATTSSIVVAPTANTGYSVTATSSANCVSSSAINVQVNGTVPSLSVANTSSATGGVCPNASVTLTGTGATTYSLSSSSGANLINGVAFVPTTSATYTVSGINACGSTSAITSISLHPLPTVTAVASTSSLCSGSTVSLTGIGTGTSYTWFGGPGIVNGAAYAPSTSANFTVVTASALSCTASATVPVTVITTPSVTSVISPSLICLGKSSTLTASGAASYNWSGGAQTATTNSYVVTPAVPGISTYTIVRANSVCTTTQVATIITNGLPTVFAIAAPTLVCAGKPTTLTVAGGQTYTWTSPGVPPTVPSFTFTGASPLAFPPVSTIYTVAAHDGTCVNTTTVFVQADPNPTIITTSSPATLCAGSTAIINATGGLSYTVTSSANSNTYSAFPITETLTASTAFNITGDNSFGCSTSTVQFVQVFGNPTLTAVPNKTLVCSGGSVSVNSTGANTYSWSNGATTQSTIVNPISSVTGPVIFTVTGTFTNTMCHADKTVAIGVFIPTLTVTGNTSTCVGGTIVLQAGGGTGALNYKWYTVPGGSPSGTQSAFSSTIAGATVFTLTGLTTSGSASLCPGTKTIDVNLFFNPTITATASRTQICVKETMVLTANGGDSYLWSTGFNTQTISVSPNSTTNYTVTGTDSNGCTNTGTIQVKVSGCSGIAEQNGANLGLNVYPNPNNGEFVIESGVNLKLTLVNDLGQLIRVIELSGANNNKVYVNDLAKGIYFLSGQKDNVQVNQKVIISK
ncbi:hypothetical protein CNR22_03475 [Sphingobacteriaceae bacterium]|nr:hypothetical protein CNR22_03475 [Sphingobacteriaceae bacterium]